MMMIVHPGVAVRSTDIPSPPTPSLPLDCLLSCCSCLRACTASAISLNVRASIRLAYNPSSASPLAFSSDRSGNVDANGVGIALTGGGTSVDVETRLSWR